jgi:3-methyladenine DNA glycosylase AlkD
VNKKLSARPASAGRRAASRAGGPSQAVRDAAADARRTLKRLARPAGELDPRRYFRGDLDLAFYNVGTIAIRALARRIYAARRDEWSIETASAFAGILIVDRHLEVKAVGIELLARYRREFAPWLLPIWKGWLTDGHAANWATTDSICGYLIGRLLIAYPALTTQMPRWARHGNLWVRRASAVSLVPSARKGLALDVAYRVAELLHPDDEDLVQKATGWLLREAGRTDMPRLDRYLRRLGPVIPRTSLRYAIERMPPLKRRQILVATRGPRDQR